MYRQVLVSMAVCAAAAMPVPAADCQAGALGDLVRQGKDIYLGELHGSNEVPALMRCLIELALAHRTPKDEKLIVSLEQQPDARDPAGEAWRGTDGRGSQAMWELTQFVIREEQAGRLEFQQQLPGPLMLKAGESPPAYDPAAYEKDMGAPLQALATRGQLLALSGNVHSRKKALPGLNYEPAGAYVGATAVHVAVEAAQGGATWCCMPAGCGVHEMPSKGSLAGAPGSLTDGAWMEHDFIYWLPKITASPPKLAAAAVQPDAATQRNGR